MRQLITSEYCIVVAQMSKDAEKMGNGIKKTSELANLEYDYIVIAVLDKGVAEEIKDELAVYN